MGVALVGYGYWGPNLARNVDASARGRLTVVCDTDETARYHRWLGGTTAGLSWEHAVFGQPIRLAADYQIMLNEPSRDSSFRQRMQALRLGVAWLH